MKFRFAFDSLIKLYIVINKHSQNSLNLIKTGRWKLLFDNNKYEEDEISCIQRRRKYKYANSPNLLIPRIYYHEMYIGLCGKFWISICVYISVCLIWKWILFIQEEPITWKRSILFTWSIINQNVFFIYTILYIITTHLFCVFAV